MKNLFFFVALFLGFNTLFAQDLTKKQSEGLEEISASMCTCSNKLFATMDADIQAVLMKVTTVKSKEEYVAYVKSLDPELQEKLPVASQDLKTKISGLQDCMKSVFPSVKTLFTVEEVGALNLDTKWFLSKVIDNLEGDKDCAFTRYLLKMSLNKISVKKN
jgi:hypothetical protein